MPVAVPPVPVAVPPVPVAVPPVPAVVAGFVRGRYAVWVGGSGFVGVRMDVCEMGMCVLGWVLLSVCTRVGEYTVGVTGGGAVTVCGLVTVWGTTYIAEQTESVEKVEFNPRGASANTVKEAKLTVARLWELFTTK